MSSRMLEVAGRTSAEWRWFATNGHPAITWWPTSLPGSDLDQAPRRRSRRTGRRPLRRGRIQLVAL